MGWEGYLSRLGERNTYRISVWKPEGKKQLGKRGHRWKNNIKSDSQDRAQWRDCMSTILNRQFAQNCS
jgi:hypothetical protein